MLTIDEKINAFKKQYKEADIIGKYQLQQMAIADMNKAHRIWEFIKEQEEITEQQYFRAIEKKGDVQEKAVKRGRPKGKTTPKRERVSTEKNINKVKDAVNNIGKEEFTKIEISEATGIDKINSLWQKLIKDKVIERANPSEKNLKMAKWKKWSSA